MAEIKSLKSFLQENAIKKENILYIASKRFIDEKGKPIEWELRTLTNDELDKLTTRYTKKIPIKGTKDYKEKFDSDAFMMALTLESVVYPNLDDVELQNDWNVVGSEALLKAMLTPGELTDLKLAASEASDFDAGMNDKIKQIKNS